MVFGIFETKYVLMAVMVHAAILALPMSDKAGKPNDKIRIIDIIVMKQEIQEKSHKPHKPNDTRRMTVKLPARPIFPPEIKAKPPPAIAAIPGERAVKKEPAAPAAAGSEKMEASAQMGGGNLLDEDIVSQLPLAGNATSDSDMAIAGLGTPKGIVGLGNGRIDGNGAGIATGNPGGLRIATTGSEGTVDTDFGAPDGPRFLHRTMPVYPFIAKRLHKEGTVLLMVIIDEKGKPREISVIGASDPMFADAAVEAVKKSAFLPARKKGVPVVSRATLPIRFSLRN